MQAHFGVFNATIGVNHQCVLGQKRRRDGDRGIQQATRIIAQIKYQSFKRAAVLLVRIDDRARHLFASVFFKLCQADDSIARLDQT